MASSELQPWAMLANGPPCTSAGVPSSVCTRLGCSASRSSAVIAGAAPSWAAVTTSPSQVRPTITRLRRSSRSPSDRARQKIAIVSEATVMSKLSSRARPRRPRRRRHAPQGAVVHVHRAAPGDARRVEPERIAPIDVVVDQRGQQVVGGGDGVEVAGEVQVDLVGRGHLGRAAARRAALHAEAGPERRLAQADQGIAPDAGQGVAEPDGGGGLALAGGGRADGGDEHQPPAPGRQLGQELAGELGLVRSITIQRPRRDADARADGLDVCKRQPPLPGPVSFSCHQNRRQVEPCPRYRTSAGCARLVAH